MGDGVNDQQGQVAVTLDELEEGPNLGAELGRQGVGEKDTPVLHFYRLRLRGSPWNEGNNSIIL